MNPAEELQHTINEGGPIAKKAMTFTYDKARGCWFSPDRAYRIWIQARVRNSHVEWAAQYRDEMPWLCETGTKTEAKRACREHAKKLKSTP